MDDGSISIMTSETQSQAPIAAQQRLGSTGSAYALIAAAGGSSGRTLLDSGSQMHALRAPRDGPGRAPQGTYAEPYHVKSFGGALSKNRGVYTTRAKDTHTGTEFVITSDNDCGDATSPSVLSVGQLQAEGWIVDLSARPPRLTTPTGAPVHVVVENNLFYVELAFTSMPTRAIAPCGAPSASLSSRVLVGMAAIAAASAGPHMQQRAVFEAYAGTGTFTHALAAQGVRIAGTLERVDHLRATLARRYPGARHYADYTDGAWTTFTWPKHAIRLFLGGPPCQDVAPTGRGRGFAGPHAPAVLGFAHMARRLGPHFICLENVLAFAEKGALQVITTLLGQPACPGEHSYRSHQPDWDIHKSHDHGSAAYRTRGIAWYERADLGLPPAPPLPPPGPDVVMHTLKDHLVDLASVPQSAYVDGTITVLDTPYRLHPDEPRSPVVAAHLTWQPSDPLRVGSMVRLDRSPAKWIILGLRRQFIDIIRDSYSEPTRATIPRTAVAEHLFQRFNVFSADSTLMSPRRWSRPPQGPNMLVLRPGTGRASRVLPREAASAMGVDTTDMPDTEIQSYVGNAVTKVLADAVAERFRQRADILEAMTQAAAAYPLVAIPAPPPLTRGRKWPLDMPLDGDTLHAAFAHISHDRLVDTCRTYGLPIPRRNTRCAACKMGNLMRRPEASKSRGQRDTARAHSVHIKLDLFGPVDPRSRAGSAYMLIGSIYTGPESPRYVVGAGLRAKSDVVADVNGWSAFRAIHAALRARGVTITSAEFDGGGEFAGGGANAMFAQLGIDPQSRTTDTHVGAVEVQHRRIYESVRPSTLAAGVPPELWEDNALHAIHMRNIATHDGVSAHAALFQEQPDTSNVMPFYSWVRALTSDYTRRFDPKAIAARYLGPHNNGGVGAITIRVGRAIRHVASYAYLGPPQAVLDERGTFVHMPPQPAVGPSHPPLPHGPQPPLSTASPPEPHQPEQAPCPVSSQAPVAITYRPDDQVLLEVSGKWHHGYISRITDTVVHFKYQDRKYRYYEEPIDMRDEHARARIRPLNHRQHAPPAASGDRAVRSRRPVPAMPPGTKHPGGGLAKAHATQQVDQAIAHTEGTSTQPGLGLLVTATTSTVTSDLSSPLHSGPTLDDILHDRQNRLRTSGRVTEVPADIAVATGEPPPPHLDGMHGPIYMGDPEDPYPDAISIPAALRRKDAAKFIEAIAKEVLWDPANFADGKPACVPVPRDQVPHGAEIRPMVATLKVRRDGVHKARFCADGSPRAGERHTKVSSPSCLSSSLLLCLAIAAQDNLGITQYDIVKAYMLAPPSSTYYLRFPHGWRDYTSKAPGEHLDPEANLLLVKKNIYGMPDAGAIWFDMLSTFLLDDLGFMHCPIDRAVFRKTTGLGTVIIAAYVDDLLVIGTDQARAQIGERLATRFPIKEGGSDYLGLHIDVHPGKITVHQQTYATKVAHKAGFSESKPVDTPLTTGWTASKTEPPDGGVPGKAAHFNFASILGAIGFLATRTMPWLQFAFGVLSTVSTDPSPGARGALARVLRFVNAYSHVGLTFTRAATFAINAYVDANHGSEPHPRAVGFCRSRSGGAILAANAAIHAFSVVQKCTAISTFEAELYALVLIIRVVLAQRRLAEFLRGTSLPPSHIWCDNQSTITNLARRDLTARSRHVRVHLGFVYDAIDSGVIIIEKIDGSTNPADTFTKAQDRLKFFASLKRLAGINIGQFIRANRCPEH